MLVGGGPDGGKEARANACQGIVAGGGVYLPDETHAKYPDGRRGAPWVPVFLHEAVTFSDGDVPAPALFSLRIDGGAAR